MGMADPDLICSALSLGAPVIDTSHFSDKVLLGLFVWAERYQLQVALDVLGWVAQLDER